MTTLKEVLSRSDSLTDDLIPQSVGPVLQAWSQEPLRSRKKGEVAISITSPEQLLRNGAYRRSIINKLRQDEAEDLASLLGVESSAGTYAALRSAQIPAYSEREELLFDFFEQEYEGRPPEEEVAVGLNTVQPSYSLFEYQQKAYSTILTKLDSDDNRVFLHMPTGSGKTRVTMSVVSEVLKRSDPGVVLWLADAKELLDQAADEFEEAWQHLGDRPVEISRFYDDHGWDQLEDGLVVAGTQKLWRKESDNPAFLANLASSVSLVVFDEAHKSLAKTYRSMIDDVTGMNEFCGLLGLSATPGRTYNDPQEDRKLAEMYDQNKITIDIQGYDNPFAYLTEKGYLSTPEFHPLKIRTEMLSTELQQKIGQVDGGNLEEILDELSEDEYRNLQICRKVDNLISEGHERIILFATTVQHARTITAVLKARDIDASLITGETPQYLRDRSIRRFKRNTNSSRVLCNYNVLTAGFDAPKTTAVLIARPTKSLVQYSQMVGRGIRGVKMGGTKNAEIWTVIDTGLPGFGDLSEAFYNWEDVW